MSLGGPGALLRPEAPTAGDSLAPAQPGHTLRRTCAHFATHPDSIHLHSATPQKHTKKHATPNGVAIR